MTVTKNIVKSEYEKIVQLSTMKTDVSYEDWDWKGEGKLNCKH